MRKRGALVDIHCIPDCYTACASPLCAAHSRLSISRCSSMAFFFFVSSSALPRFPSAHHRAPSLPRTVFGPRGTRLHRACRSRLRRMHGRGRLEGGQRGCRRAWLTVEDGSLLQAELEAACTESECAESEDGGEEGHGVWGEGGGGGGVGGGSEKVRVSQAAPAPIGVFQNAASSFVHLIRPIHLTSVFLFSPHPSSTHNHEAHSSRPLWHAPT